MYLWKPPLSHIRAATNVCPNGGNVWLLTDGGGGGKEGGSGAKWSLLRVEVCDSDTSTTVSRPYG